MRTIAIVLAILGISAAIAKFIIKSNQHDPDDAKSLVLTDEETGKKYPSALETRRVR